jgi:hypothetical protein
MQLVQKVTGIFPTGAVASRIETIRTRLVGGISYVAMGKLRARIAEGLSSSKKRRARR